MGILDSLKGYHGKFQVVDEEVITEETFANVESVSTVPSDYGISVCFTMKSDDATYGRYKYFPYAKDSKVIENVTKEQLLGGKLLKLSRPGDRDIVRIKI